MARIRSIKPEEWKDQQQPWGAARSKVYVIQEEDSGPVKIGIAAHPTRRLSVLRCGNYRPLRLLAVFEGTDTACKEVERCAHRFFADFRIGGEWFSIEPRDLLAFISAFEGDSK